MTIEQINSDFLRSVDVHGILPQQEPFVMIGSLTAFSMESSTTQTTVNEENIFVDDGYFSAAGMMENIAQTCAARIGFYNKYILHNEVQLGFIGAIRNYVIHELAPVGATITTKVDILEDVFGMIMANASVMCDDKLLASCEVKLAVRNQEI